MSLPLHAQHTPAPNQGSPDENHPFVRGVAASSDINLPIYVLYAPLWTPTQPS